MTPSTEDSGIRRDPLDAPGVRFEGEGLTVGNDVMPIDLSVFCSKTDRRYHLNAPFSRADYTWATDGKIMIRVPLHADVPEVEGAPHAERVWTNAGGEFVPVKPFPIPKPVELRCDVCDGRGTKHDCPDCTCTCSECEGSGMLDEAVSVSIGDGCCMQRKYAVKIMSLPNLYVEVPLAKADRMHFRFDGGEGILMLLRAGHGRVTVADLILGVPPA